MIYSKISTTEKGGEKFKRVLHELEKYKEAYVTIGLHEGAGDYPDGTSVVEVGLWNEFGTRTIPERSWLRSAIDDNASKINAWREEAIENILEKGWSVEKALEMVGLRIQILIQNKIKSNIPPEYGAGRHGNSQASIDRAQNAKRALGQPPVTLIASNLMLRSVTTKVVLK